MHDQALARYHPSPFPGRLTLFATESLRAVSEDEWRKVARDGVAVLPIPGTHENIVEGPPAGAVADVLMSAVEQAEEAREASSSTAPSISH